jgi:hypothetical protein
METIRTMQRINETKGWFFKPDRKTQINKVRDEKGDIKIDNNKVQKIIREYFENLYSNKLENLEEMYKFLDRYDLPKLNKRL